MHAAAFLRDMTPIRSTTAFKAGLVDLEIGTYASSQSELDHLSIEHIKSVLTAEAQIPIRCAPWCRPGISSPSSKNIGLTDAMSDAKSQTYSSPTFTPLLHYRNEELSQMLLDCFHPIRSKRYHERRYRFIRKVKATSTPARYRKHGGIGFDEEDLPSFDDAPGWNRGEEWGWVGSPTPGSLATSESTRVKLYPGEPNSSDSQAVSGKGSREEEIQQRILSPSSKRKPSQTIIKGDPGKMLRTLGQLPTPPTSEENLAGLLEVKTTMMSIKYVAPEIKGKEEVEFPCLYEPSAAV